MKMKKLAALLCALILCLVGMAASAENTTVQEGDNDMQMMIGETPVTVAWEDNASVEALRALAAKGLTGAIGQSLPRDDAQTTTTSGDIVLYSGNQLVVFYGSNSWAYTRLGRITDQTPEQMKALLGNEDVTITLSMK